MDSSSFRSFHSVTSSLDQFFFSSAEEISEVEIVGMDLMLEDHRRCSDDIHDLDSIDLLVSNDLNDVIVAKLSYKGSSDPLILDCVHEGNCSEFKSMRFACHDVNSMILTKESMPLTYQDRSRDYKSFPKSPLKPGTGLMCETDSLILDRKRWSRRSNQCGALATFRMIHSNSSPSDAVDFVDYEMPLNDLDSSETQRDPAFTSGPRRIRRGTSTENMLRSKGRFFVSR